MEQTVSEKPFSQEQHISQLHTRHNGTANSSGAQLEQDQRERWCPRRWTGQRGTAHSGSFGGDNLRQDTVQTPICRDNLRGRCARGAFCKYQHSESDEHDRSRFCQNEREKLGPVATLGNSQSYRANEDTDSTTRFSSRGCRSRSPCRRFQSGRCYRGVSCPYLHPEMTSFDKSVCDSSVDQQRVDRAVRDPDFGGRDSDNFVRIPQEHVEADKENNSRTISFSGESRSRSPCQHFLRGRCDFGASCKRWHPVKAYVRPGHDLNTQHHKGNAATSSYPDPGERSQDVPSRTFREHDEANMHCHLRTGAFSREPRSRSPCRNFLSGKCYRGASCVHLHPVTVHDRPRFDLWSAQQHQGVSGTSRSPHLDDGSMATTFRISQNHKDCKNCAIEPYQDTHAFYEQNKAWSTKDGVQLAGNRENMDVTSRRWSYEGQRSRLAGDFGGDKPIREVCLQFTKGRCNRGEFCRYLHGFHEYATSTSNWSLKPDTESAGGSRNFSVANKYANSMMAQEHADVKNYQMSLGEIKHSESNLISSDGCFDKEAKGRPVDAIEPKFLDCKGDATIMNGLKCDVSGEKVETFRNSAEGHENISLWSPPFKRQRSSYRGDNFHCQKFGRYDSRNDLRGGRSYNVAQFQYPDLRSYRYEKPMYHANSQHHKSGEATSVNRCSHENNDSNWVTPRHEEVVTQGLPLEQCANVGHDSNVVITGRKIEADSARYALQPSPTNQNGKESTTDSVAACSEGAAAVSQDALDTGSTRLCEEHLVSPWVMGQTMLDKDVNVEVPIDMGQEGKEKTVDLISSIKTYSRKKSRKRHPISCEETMREEISDASKQGMPSCSVVDALSSGPNIASVSGILVDMELSASRNNDLDNVLVDDHPVKVKKKHKKKHPSSASCEKTVNEEVTEASKPGTPISSLVETSLSNPNIASVSGVSVDMELSVSRNNDLENVVVHDHPVKGKVKKLKRKLHSNSASCEGTLTVEVTDASKQGMSSCSSVEDSLSSPSIASVSGVPVDMELSASRSNDMENVVVHDHQVKRKAKKKLKRTLYPDSVFCEQTVTVEVTDASKPGTPISSFAETPLSNPNIASVSGIPVDMELSASRNNDLGNVVVHDHPVKRRIKKKIKRKHHSDSASCEDTMIVEVTDASKSGTPISSLVETSLSNPNIAPVSGVPVDTELSASRSNDLENLLVDNHPVKEKKCKKQRPSPESCKETMKEEGTKASKLGMPISPLVETSLSNPVKQQENGSVTNKTENNVESAFATPEYGTLLLGNAGGCSLQSSVKGVIPNSRRKLLVLDVNGLLVDIVATYNPRYKPDTKLATKAVFKRPFCDDFLQFCFEKFDVGIWSSRVRKNLTRVVDFLMRDTKNKLLFCWDQSHCTATGYKTPENREKPLVLKELRYLWWDNKWESLPWDKGYYNETNTLLLDDSPYKALRNPPYTAIFPRPYTHKNAGDNSLGPGGDLREYLERLAEAENVPKFIQENPFGQKPISNTSRNWRFYSKIVGTYGSQQEEYANIIPNS